MFVLQLIAKAFTAGTSKTSFSQQDHGDSFIKSIVKKYSSGNMLLKRGLYATSLDIDRRRKNVCNHRYSS